MANGLQSSLNRTYKDRFLFSFNLPEALKSAKTEYIKMNQAVGLTKDAVDFSLIAVNIPSITTKSENVPYAGSSINISSHTRSPYDPIIIKFKIDNGFTNYLMMYEWLNFIYDARAGYFDSHNLSKDHSIASYQTNISVTALDNYQNPLVQWIFTHAYPSNLSSIDYDYQTSDELECTATFEFAQMIVRHIALEEKKHQALLNKV